MRQWACGFGGIFARPQAGVWPGMGGRTGKHGRRYGRARAEVPAPKGWKSGRDAARRVLAADEMLIHIII